MTVRARPWHPVVVVPLITRWCAEASSDLLRRAACGGRCGAKGRISHRI
jgi:hypothetical protein